jgi:hypothetical protein
MAAQHTLKPEEFHMQRRAHGIRTSCEMRPEGELVETSHKLMERIVFFASHVMFDDTLIDDEQMFISKIGETTPTTS